MDRKRKLLLVFLITVSLFLIGAGQPSSAQPFFTDKIRINEVMVNPKKIDDGFGEWFELQNASDVEINLQGMVITDFTEDFHIISPMKPLFVKPGELVVMGRSVFQEKNGGVNVDYAYGGDLTLENESDMLALLFGPEIIDIFVYSNEFYQMVEGFSLNLEPIPFDSPLPLMNKIWCTSWKSYDEAGDNFGTPGLPNTYCDNDGDSFSEDQGDCRDDDPSVYPGVLEKCNGVDDNCNGIMDENLSNDDYICYGMGVCSGVKPVCGGVNGWICPAPPEYEEIEKTCDGLDNDCDGETDEELTAPITECLSLGVCAGAVLKCKGDAGWLCSYPESYEEIESSCDGLDNDCDGETDDGYKIGEECEAGYGECRTTGVRVCSEDGKEVLCHVSEVKNPSLELCDGLDNDCDGKTDNGFPVGEQCVSGTGICKVTGKYICSSNGAYVECSTKPLEPEIEFCGDLLDNDCNGFTDEEGCEIAGEKGEGGCSASTGARSFPLFIFISILTTAVIYIKKSLV